MEQVSLKQIESWMYEHRKDIIKDMESIVNIPSISQPDSTVAPFGQNCRDVLDMMLSIAAGHGLDTVNYEYYCGRITAKPADEGGLGSEVGIWTHLDVVPEGGGWNYPPFQMTQKDGFLIGRGVQDNKSCVIGVMYALLCLRDLHIPVSHRYSLYVGCSEENTMDDAAYVTDHYVVPGFNLVADCGFPVCFGEMGSITVRYMTTARLPKEILGIEAGTASNSIPDLAVIRLRNGALTQEQLEQLGQMADISVSVQNSEIRVEAIGASAHIITPGQGKNAVKRLAEALSAIGMEDRFWWLSFLCAACVDGYGTGIGIARKDGVSGALVGTVTRMYIMEDRLCILAEYRYPVLDADGSRADGKELERQLKAVGKPYRLDAVISRHSKAMYHPPEEREVQQLTKSFHHHSGFSNQPYTMSGGTYARKLPNAVGFGMSMPDKRIYRPDPEDLRGDYHQADESVCIEQMLKASALYVACLAELE